MKLFYWFTIVLGIILLSISISNPVFNLVINRYIKFPLLFIIIIRLLLFFISIIIIFIGLYLESIL